MKVEQIMTMVGRMVFRRVLNKGINKGFDYIGEANEKRRAKKQGAAPDPYQDNDARYAQAPQGQYIQPGTYYAEDAMVGPDVAASAPQPRANAPAREDVQAQRQAQKQAQRESQDQARKDRQSQQQMKKTAKMATRMARRMGRF
jgi:hypothetical protein